MNCDFKPGDLVRIKAPICTNPNDDRYPMDTVMDAGGYDDTYCKLFDNQVIVEIERINQGGRRYNSNFIVYVNVPEPYVGNFKSLGLRHFDLEKVFEL